MLTNHLVLYLLLSTLVPGHATKKAAIDLSWIKDLTVPGGSIAAGQGNKLNTDPRFVALLQSALKQHQFFWRDRGSFTPLLDLAHTFLAIPGNAVLVEQRYAVVDGCVPHACSARGMVWVDTQASSHPPLIFVATDIVNGGDRPEGGPPVHLWLFSSTKLNWQRLPPSFVSSLSQWWSTTAKGWAQFYSGHSERVVVVSLAQPSGEIVTLSPDLFRFNPK